jgi:hypothetical protein
MLVNTGVVKSSYGKYIRDTNRRPHGFVIIFTDDAGARYAGASFCAPKYWRRWSCHEARARAIRNAQALPQLGVTQAWLDAHIPPSCHAELRSMLAEIEHRALSA